MNLLECANQDTIAAVATAPGKGGIGIVRLSGANARLIAETITATTLQPRHAHYCNFFDVKPPLNNKLKLFADNTSNSEKLSQQALIDQGIVLYFPGPHSFTGEDCVELQGHGGPVILDALLRVMLSLGARLARPGEFSERAFLNNKIDLAQAEAIADLIESATDAAAKSALRSLQGEFSKQINQLVESVTSLRIHVEAAIDFPEEEIDFLADGIIENKLLQLIDRLQDVINAAQQGNILQDGMRVVIAGPPNAGKSSLLNALSGTESAIVTSIAGTTRDVLREQIQIDGMPVHIIDTAGLRDSPDEIEREGIRRAWLEIETADQILLVVDSNTNSSVQPEDIQPELVNKLSSLTTLSIVRNKCDLSGLKPGIEEGSSHGLPIVTLSARQNLGIDYLREHLKRCIGFEDKAKNTFSARRRHLEALDLAQSYLLAGKIQLLEAGAGELLADDLRLCQQALGEITGEFSSDDLLGKIFSSFCIGK